MPIAPPSRAPWGYCIPIGLLSTVGLALGSYLHGCKSIGDALAMTVLLFALFALAMPSVFLVLAAVTTGVTLVLRALSSNLRVRENLAMIAVVLPLACCVVGFFLTSSGAQKNMCTLKT